jgi:hypothetical protein
MEWNFTQAAPFRGFHLNGGLTVTDAMVSVPSTLTDAATIATDARLGNRFRVSSATDRTLGAPSNGADGQQCTWRWKNTDSGSRTLTLNTGTGGFRLNGFTVGATAAGKYLMLTAEYHAGDNKWDVLAVVNDIG